MIQGSSAFAKLPLKESRHIGIVRNVVIWRIMPDVYTILLNHKIAEENPQKEGNGRDYPKQSSWRTAHLLFRKEECLAKPDNGPAQSGPARNCFPTLRDSDRLPIRFVALDPDGIEGPGTELEKHSFCDPMFSTESFCFIRKNNFICAHAFSPVIEYRVLRQDWWKKFKIILLTTNKSNISLYHKIIF